MSQCFAPADHGEHGGDGWIGESIVEVSGPVAWVCAERAGRRVLDGLQAKLVTQPPEPQLVHLGEHLRQAGGGGHYGDPGRPAWVSAGGSAAAFRHTNDRHRMPNVNIAAATTLVS